MAIGIMLLPNHKQNRAGEDIIHVYAKFDEETLFVEFCVLVQKNILSQKNLGENRKVQRRTSGPEDQNLPLISYT